MLTNEQPTDFTTTEDKSVTKLHRFRNQPHTQSTLEKEHQQIQKIKENIKSIPTRNTMRNKKKHKNNTNNSTHTLTAVSSARAEK